MALQRTDWGRHRQGGRGKQTHRPVAKTAGQVSAACAREDHARCYKLDCPCACHGLEGKP